MPCEGRKLPYILLVWELGQWETNKSILDFQTYPIELPLTDCNKFGPHL